MNRSMADGMKAGDHDSYTMARMLDRNYKYVLVLRAMHVKRLHNSHN